MARSLVAALALAALFAAAPNAAVPADAADLAPASLVEMAAKKDLKVAAFAAGCYWCVESDFDKVPGVVETTSGFMGGRVPNPTYEQVARGRTGHAEIVLVSYDPKKVRYEDLLDNYWRHVDFLDGGGQFCDRGIAYRPAIFTFDETQRVLAEASKEKLAKSVTLPRPIAVRIQPASTFTAGPEEHQDYYLKKPFAYSYYRWGCGRDRRITKLWQMVKPAASNM